MNRALACWLASALAITASHARADEGIVTDRPDFTETSWVVGVGKVQIESGLTVTGLAGDDRVRSLNAPEGLLRFGFHPRTELRLGLDRQWRSVAGRSHAASIGFKIQLMPDDARFGIALLPAIEGPLWREDDLSGEGSSWRHATSSLALAWAGGLPDPWSIGGMLEADTEDVFAGTLSLARALGPGVGAFLEWATEMDPDETSHLVHHGYTLALGSGMQLDAHAGLGLTEDAPDYFVGAGFALKR